MLCVCVGPATPLTLQVNFPRTPRVRKRWLMRRVFELACFTGLLLFISAQYLEPAVSNAIMPLSQSDWVRVVERVLKLALPNLYAWLVRGQGGGERGGGGPSQEEGRGVELCLMHACVVRVCIVCGCCTGADATQDGSM